MTTFADKFLPVGSGPEDLGVGFAKRRQWWLRSHDGKVPCPSCGFFDSLAEAQKPSADNQVNKAIIHVREV
jgi:hypothetical protein